MLADDYQLHRMRNYFNSLSPRTRGIAFIMFSVLVWSGWMVISGYGVRSGLSAYDITALRFGTAGIILFPILLKKGFRLGPWGIWGGIWLAFMMGAPYNIIAIWGMKMAPTSHASLINTFMVLMTTLGGVVLLREKTSALRITGLLISIAGVFCLLTAKSTGASENMLLGHVLFIVSGCIWAVYAVSAKSWKIDPMHTTAAVCFYSGAIYVPIYLLFIPSQMSMANLDAAVFQAVFQGVINSVFALLCFNRAIQLLGASTSSAFLPLIPALATVVSIPVLGQVPNAQEWLGVALACGGVFLSSGILGRLLGQKENALSN